MFSRNPKSTQILPHSLHKLEQEGATLVTAYESSIALGEALEGDKSGLSSYTLDLYLGTYFPNYIDKSCCISMVASSPLDGKSI